MYKCGWQGCEKAYGTLNHLNAHVTMQSHGQKRTPEGMLCILGFGRRKVAYLVRFSCSISRVTQHEPRCLALTLYRFTPRLSAGILWCTLVPRLASFANMNIQNSKKSAKNGSRERKKRRRSGRTRMNDSVEAPPARALMVKAMTLRNLPRAKTTLLVQDHTSRRSDMLPLVVRCSHSTPTGLTRFTKPKATAKSTLAIHHTRRMVQGNKCEQAS